MTTWRVAVLSAAILLGAALVFLAAAPPIPRGIIERPTP